MPSQHNGDINSSPNVHIVINFPDIQFGDFSHKSGMVFRIKLKRYLNIVKNNSSWVRVVICQFKRCVNRIIRSLFNLVGTISRGFSGPSCSIFLKVIERSNQFIVNFIQAYLLGKRVPHFCNKSDSQGFKMHVHVYGMIHMMKNIYAGENSPRR